MNSLDGENRVRINAYVSQSGAKRIGNIELIEGDKGVTIRLNSWTGRTSLKAYLTNDQAMEVSAALAFLAGKEPPAGKKEGEVTSSTQKWTSVEISLKGDLFCVFGDKDKFRDKLHKALDRAFNDAFLPTPMEDNNDK